MHCGSIFNLIISRGNLYVCLRFLFSLHVLKIQLWFSIEYVSPSTLKYFIFYTLRQGCGSGWVWPGSESDLREKKTGSGNPSSKNPGSGSDPRKKNRIRIRLNIPGSATLLRIRGCEFLDLIKLSLEDEIFSIFWIEILKRNYSLLNIYVLSVQQVLAHFV